VLRAQLENRELQVLELLEPQVILELLELKAQPDRQELQEYKV
jgi:short-subunit dehydrogenase involved in D-alanine esterification of teichoic acids